MRQMTRDLVLNTVASSGLVTVRGRRWLLRRIGLRLGSGVKVQPDCWFGSNRVTIGAGTFVNYGCFFNTSAEVIIGERCALGMQVMVCTSTHEIGPHERRPGRRVDEPVRIGDGVWIGARVTILPGTTIGNGAVIAAGAVVAGDVPPDSVYGGVPARQLRQLEN